MIKAKPANNVQPVTFEWDEKFKVLIGEVPIAMVHKLMKKNEETIFDAKHQRKTDTNWLKYGREFMLKAIQGWVGMTYRYLLEICRPIELDPGVKLDDPIEFSEDSLAFVADNYNVQFGGFVGNGTDKVNEIYVEQKKKELENL